MAQDTYKTYVPLQAITLTSNTSVVQFGVNPASGSSADWIPQHYIDIVIIVQGTSVNGSSSGLTYRFNGSTTNYTYSIVESWGANTPNSYRSSSQTSLSVGWNGQYSATGWAGSRIQVMNYANSVGHKVVLTEQAGTGGSDVALSTWADTSPVKTIQIALGSTFPDDTWAIGSTFTLYGIGLKDRV